MTTLINEIKSYITPNLFYTKHKTITVRHYQSANPKNNEPETDTKKIATIILTLGITANIISFGLDNPQMTLSGPLASNYDDKLLGMRI